MPDLLECLTALYPTVEAVGRIAVKAGIPKRFVDLNGEANRFCSSLIEQARLRNRIERLIEAASGEYPERSEDLRAAQQEYLLHNQDLESIRDAKQGLVSLADLLREPELRVQVIEFRVWFVNVSGQIEVLRCYKALHDELHLLEYHCYNFVIQEVRRVADLRRRRLPDHPDPNELAAELRDCVRWDQIDQPEIELRGISHRLRQTVASRRLPPSETAWVEELTPALTDLSEVLKLHDLARLDRVGGALSRVIRIRPAQVNSRLFRAAIDVHLEGLVETLDHIRARLVEAGVEPSRLNPLQTGQAALASLNRTLSGLVDEHDKWQEVDIELRHIEDTLGFDLTILEIEWPGVRQRIQTLDDDDDEVLAQALREDAERLETALAEHNPIQIGRHFQRYRRQAAYRFRDVDETLKSLCGELTKVAGPVAVVLDSMNGGPP